MDPRLNLAILESHESDLRRHADAARRQRRWPDDGQPPRFAGERRRLGPLHPQAVLASILTWR